MSLLKPDETLEKPSDQSQEVLPSCDSFGVVEQINKDVREIQENLERPIQKQIRIYLLRHYPKNEAEGGYYSDLNKVPGDLKKTYDGILSDSSKTLFVYDATTSLPRVQSTADDILRKYPIPADQIIRDVKLEGSYDANEDPLTRKKRTIEEFEVLKKMLQERDLSNIDTIVIVSNRTYSQPFDLLSGGNKDITQEALESSGYQFRDFDTSLNPIIPTNTSLLISPELFESFRDIFPNLTPARSCQELQAKIEWAFHKDQTLFSYYLAHPSSPVSLRVFCLANLLWSERLEDKKTLRTYIHNFMAKKSSIPFQELGVFLRTKNRVIFAKEALLTSLLYMKNVWEVDLLCRTCWCMLMYKEVNILAQIFRSSNFCSENIFRNSLDKLIQQTDGGTGLIRRWLYGFCRKPESELAKMRKERWNISKDEEYDVVPVYISTILSASEKPFVLLGHVGDGKSIELAKMKYVIDTDPEYADIIPLFYSAKTNNKYPIQKMKYDIQCVFDAFPNKKIVVFFDGIDELDKVTRIQVVDYLNAINTDRKEDQRISVIMGSRPSGFDGFEENSIHFSNIHDSDKRDFLTSRLRSLGVLENNISNILEEIYTFLGKNILDEDLKNTPLVLFFLCKLSVEGVLSSIENRSSLYEKIIKRIIVDHNISKWYTHTEDYIEEDLDKLSAIAFDIYCGHPIGLSETRAQKLAILFKQIWKKEYGFIHRSFEEYFLARYFTKHPNGKNTIFKKRDDCMTGNWNEWRNFRPVVMFYGEILVNEERWDELVEFLGEEGLLNQEGDDIFGENFFVGLEVLYRLPEGIQNREDIQWILGKYEKIAGNWHINGIIRKFEQIKRLARNTGHKDRVFFNEIIPKITEWIIENVSVDPWERPDDIVSVKSAMYAEIWTPQAILEAIRCIKNTTDEHKYLEVRDIYVKIAEIRTAEAIEAARRGANMLMSIGKYKEASWVYYNIAKIGTAEAIKVAKKWIRDLASNGDASIIWLMYLVFAKTGDMEAIKVVLACADLLMRDVNTERDGVYLYEELIMFWEPYIIESILVRAQNLFRTKNLIHAHHIYRSLVKSGNTEVMKMMLECAREGANPDLSLYIYRDIAEIGTPTAIQEALKGAEIISHWEDFYYAWQIYEVIARIGNTQFRQSAIQGLGVLAKKGCDFSRALLHQLSVKTWIDGRTLSLVEKRAREMLRYDNLGFMDNYGPLHHNACEIYEEIAKIWTLEAVQIVKNGIEELSNRGDDWAVCSLYSVIIKAWYLEIIPEAEAYAKNFLGKGLFSNAALVYQVIAQVGSPEAIRVAMRWIDILLESKKYSEAKIIHGELSRVPVRINDI